MTRNRWRRYAEEGSSAFVLNPHKKLIIAFINGAIIEFLNIQNDWHIPNSLNNISTERDYISFSGDNQYRIRPW